MNYYCQYCGAKASSIASLTGFNLSTPPEWREQRQTRLI